MSDLVQKLRKMAQCVYLAADEGVAADISRAVHDAAKEIERLTEANLRLVALLLDTRQIVWDVATSPDGRVDLTQGQDALKVLARLDAALGGRDE